MTSISHDKPITTSLTVSSPTPSSPFDAAQRSPWHSPVPYLFGGLAAMLGLIAFALLILACSYRRRSRRHGDADLERGGVTGWGAKQGEAGDVDSAKLYEEKILVIMAGDENPTYLATPVCANCSCFNDGFRIDSERDEENCGNCEKSEKEVQNHGVQDTSSTPPENDGTQQTQQQDQ